MKNLLCTLLLIWFGHMVAQAQRYPIENAEQLQQLVVSPDMEQLKLMIFDDTHVYADRFIYFAVLQGLAKDGVPTTIAASVAAQKQGENFMHKCRICDATKQAFTHYSQYGATYGTDKNPYPALVSTNANERHGAIKNLIERYTSAFNTLLNLSTIEQERLQQALGMMRKQGNAASGKTCPGCGGMGH